VFKGKGKGPVLAIALLTSQTCDQKR